MLPDSLFAQVLPDSAASQTDSFQDADSFQAVFTATTASVSFLSHILTGTTGKLGTSNSMLKQ
jgi:hypothetical protein